jgi:hypothetical protein
MGPIYKGWGTCLDCGYEGMLEYAGVEGEDYTDSEALGVVMLLHCPACETQDHALISMEYFKDMVVEV